MMLLQKLLILNSYLRNFELIELLTCLTTAEILPESFEEKKQSSGF